MATAILYAPSGITPATARTTPAPGFTPGPWREHSHRQIGPKAGIVAEVWSAIGEDDEDAIAQADANCLLVAAAPELYQACADAESLLTRQCHLATERTEEGRALLALRAALASARSGIYSRNGGEA